jgi:tetratricopeptide (TPR) repeat protein
MPPKRKLVIALILILIPPAIGLGIATTLGWLRLEWSLTGVGHPIAIYAGWIAILAGLAEIGGFLREKEPPGPRPDVVYQPPEPPKDFVGRESEIKRLTRTLKPGAKVAVTSVVGMGGVGKTELAKVAVYRVARRFRDGVLWADFELEGMETIADRWASALGEEQLPGDDLSAKAAAWRGLVSSTELLLVFDNVQPGQEIELLRPSYGRNAVLITTRHGDHPALRGVEKIALDQFTHAEAIALAEEVLGRSRAREQAGDATHLFELVGYLPLAVSIALYLARDSEFRLVDLNAQLEKAGAIKVLDSAENLRKSVQATFETAWENLPEDLRLTFRTLTLFNSGPSFSTWALAETLKLEEAEAHARLRRLAGRSLLNVVGEERWALHPLLREFAATRRPVDEASHARMARHYMQVAGAANDLFLQGGENVLRGLALFDAEWLHIQAGQAWAAAHAGSSQEAARLCNDYPDAGVHCLDLRQHPQEWIHWLEAAVVAARRLEDRHGEGNHLGNLGNAYAALGEARRAIEYLEQALTIAREIGDRSNEGNWLGSMGLAYRALGQVEQAIEYHQRALTIAREICAASTERSAEWAAARRGEAHQLGNLGNAYHELEQMERAIEYHEQALAIAREIGDWHGEGDDLGNLGNAYQDLGQLERAAEYHKLALAIHCEIGDRGGEGLDLGNLGHAYYHLGQVKHAIGYYKQALDLAREIGDRHSEGIWLDHLGLAYRDLGQVEEARNCIEQALTIFEEIKSPGAEQARRDLDSLKRGDDAPGLEA